MLAPWKQNSNKPRQRIKKQRHHFDNKGLSGQSYGFSSGHVWMWELDHKEDWEPMNWCLWTVVLEKTHESPLDSKEIKPINPIGNQSWNSLKGLMLKLKLQYFGHLMQRADSFGKDPDAGKDWRQLEKGNNRGWDGWMALLTQWTGVWANSGDSEGQGSLVCCSPWDHKESDMT